MTTARWTKSTSACKDLFDFYLFNFESMNIDDTNSKRPVTPSLPQFPSIEEPKKERFNKTIANISDVKGVKFVDDVIGDNEHQQQSHSILKQNETYIDLNISQDNVPEYVIHWQTLTNRLTNINKNISQLLTAHEEQFLAAFTHQMHKLQEELTILKINMDERILQEKRNKKILVLQQHLNYFRAQATRLEAERNSFLQKISTLEKELEGARRDRKYFESFLREERKAAEGKGFEGMEKEKWWRTVVEELAKKKAEDVWKEHIESKEASLMVSNPVSQQNSTRIRDFRVAGGSRLGSAVTTGRRKQQETGQEYLERKNQEIEELLETQTERRGLKWVRGTRGYTKREIRDFGKYREENEIIQIMKNCIYEVKRDIMLKNSQIKIYKRQKPCRYKSAVNLKATEEDDSNISVHSNNLSAQQKYSIVQKFLNHEFILEKLKDVIDHELAKSSTFLYPESNQIKRNVQNLNTIRLRSAKPVSQKSTARQTNATKSRSRSKCSFYTWS